MADVSPAPPLVTQMLGKTLQGRYKITHKLGGGGFGDTYLAIDERTPNHPKRVVKHLKPKDPDPAVLQVARRLFRTEAEVLYRLRHDQIPEFVDHFEENGEFYLVQDFIDGDDLSKTELLPGKQLTELEVIRILQGILEVLVFVHQHHVIHRDINPKNIIRRKQDGKLVLIDFGAVKEINTLVTTTKRQMSATVIGTPGYTPSEQGHGQPQLCSDVYAVGMIGIQALTGIQARQFPKNPKTLELVWRNKARVSPELADILDKMVRFHFNERYPSAVEALQALTALMNSNETLESPPTQISLFTNKPLLKRKSALLFAVVGSLVALVVCVTVLLNVNKPSFLTYEDPQNGIKIKYPEDWQKQQIPPNPFSNDVVAFISPQKDKNDFSERLVVTVEPLDSNLPLEEYTKLAITQILQQNDNAQIISEKQETLAGKRAYSVVYIVSDDRNDLKKMEIWTVADSKAYSITYEAEADEYDKFLNTAEMVMQSLQVE